jgi:hypothetical protein
MAVCVTEQRITATNFRSLFKAPDNRLLRIYVKGEMSLADKTLQKTAKTASLGARARSTSRRARKR